MPIHLIWGNDNAATDRALEKIIADVIDPAWGEINLSRLNGTEIANANRALEEIRTPPFGSGGRIIILKNSPFCNGCSNDLGESFCTTINLIPSNSFLILCNTNKPDGRLKTTKSIQKLIKEKKALEKSFILPAVWDESGQKELVKKACSELGYGIDQDAILILVESIGNDSSRLYLELEKLALLASKRNNYCKDNKNKILISKAIVKELIGGITTNALQIGESILKDNLGDAILKIDALVDGGEPPLRILASLTGQVRGWLWVSLLEKEGEKDVSIIAKAAGIANPKRIYILRKQIQGKPTQKFLNLLSCLLDIESAMKKGALSKNAFRDGLLTGKSFD
mgnify:CR=1 FL=1